MPDIVTSPSAGTALPMGLVRRSIGVLTSPRAAYADIARRPRALGALALGLAVVVGATFAFLMTSVGQDALLDQQYDAMERMESLGFRMPQEAFDRLEETIDRAAYLTALSQTVGVLIAVAALAGLIIVVFNF